MAWAEGAAVVERLLDRHELQRVAPDPDVAARLVEDARRHLESAAVLQPTDPTAAYSLLYDAARKACAGLLEAQGLRATSRGGHLAIREAVEAQFGGLTGGSVLRVYDRLRRRRNAIEYPDVAATPDAAEIEEALARATAIVDFAERLLPHVPAN